jgi:flagellar assembly factor FliW
MKANTRIFGEIDIADDKIITMAKGMIGFPDLQHFALIFDEERDAKQFSIMWLQSMDDGDIAFPVIVPTLIMPDYHPTVSDEIVSPLGELTGDNTYLLTTVKVPKNIEDIACNLKAPIVINTDNNKAVQLIVEDEYDMHYPIYNLIKSLKKEKAGE